MFGFPQDQFHNFIAAASSTGTATPRTLSNISNPPLPPPPLSFPSSFPINFNAYPSSSHDHLHLQQMHEQQPGAVLLLNKHDDDDNEDARNQEKKVSSSDHAVAQIVMDHHPWSNDEVLSLLRIRSSMDNWFPDLTWKHVSRKLGEFGFKRSAEKCKEKFEEETRNFNSICFNKTRFENELEDLMFHGGKSQKNNDNEEVEEEDVAVENPPPQVELSHENVKKSAAAAAASSSSRHMNNVTKRKREKKFEEFCIEIVNKMMAHQEEMYNRLIHDMLSRDEEKIAREEARRKQEMENFIKQIEIRRHEQAIAGERQATFIEILNKFTASEELEKLDLLEVSNTLSFLMTSSYHFAPQNNELASTESNPSSISNLPHKSDGDNNNTIPPPPLPLKTCNQIDDIGRRWPKDEVLALINVRCKLNANNNNEESASGSKAGSSSLWERISLGMMEFGYKRSAKRCKEKWENINKYFRKTKDNENKKKKRCVDSRTCPYFQQLSSLYDQGTLVAPAERN